MPAPTLDAVPTLSAFVSRSLKSMMPLAEDGERLEALRSLAARPWDDARMQARLDDILRGAASSEALAAALRVLRREVVVSLAARNASGACGYDEVVDTMTRFAELAVSLVAAAQSRALAERCGVPTGQGGAPQDLLVVGMGKLGGGELNVSSDIDLVFLYDEDGETAPAPEFPNGTRTLANSEFFTRLARRVIADLNDLSGPGFVFRVDMRLRPNGDSGPLVCSSDMLEEYLYAQGRDWERFAWLKSRIVNRPVFASQAAFDAAKRGIESLVRPFVYRKYLDFSAIASLTKLHEAIRAETDRRERDKGREGVNVKLGRGGIREIEFIAQTLQVIRGGRDPSLRGRSTLPMLDALAAAHALPEKTAQRLKRHYVFLRDVEHALQYVDDKQTQWLPREGDVLERAAGLLGRTPEGLWLQVEEVREFVAKAFDSIFQVNQAKSEAEKAWPAGWAADTPGARDELQARLTAMGYGSRVDELAARILQLTAGRHAALLSEGARERLLKLVEFVVEKTPFWRKIGEAASIEPDEALSRYLKLLESIAGRSTYVALLFQYPKAAARVGRVLSASRWSAEYIVRHPIVLDELIDMRNDEFDSYTPVDWSSWSERLRLALVAAQGDQERQMNLLRDAHHAAVFRLLIADLDGRFTVERLADQLSALADAVIAEVIELAWESLAQKTGDRPKFAVIGYGKLGGKELGYASDLDLVFLYDDPSPEAGAVYSRLVRRMMSWLTLQTSSGKLFDVDLRLRPNGENGLAVASLEMFERYQREEAWLWEHQALSRARFVAGDADLGRRVEAVRSAVLSAPRDRGELARGILAMRAKMLEGHPNRSAYFDVKHDRGGMVDVEFIVQYLVLGYACEHAALTNNFGNILLLEMAAREGLIDEVLASGAVKAYRRYRTLQHEIRLNAGESALSRVPPELAAEDRQAVLSLWRSVFGVDGPARGEPAPVLPEKLRIG